MASDIACSDYPGWYSSQCPLREPQGSRQFGRISYTSKLSSFFAPSIFWIRSSKLPMRVSAEQMAVSASRQGMTQFPKCLILHPEDKSIEAEVEWSITAVDSAMVVRTDEHKVPEIIVATSANPADVVRFA